MAYTPSQKEILFKKVIRRLQSGEPLGQILSDKGTPSRTAFYNWCDEDEEMAERYTRAKEIAAAALFDRMLAIAENPLLETIEVVGTFGDSTTTKDNIARSRLMIDVIKWRLAKELPSKYGDKIDVTSDNAAINMPAIVGMSVQNTKPAYDPNEQTPGSED